MNGSTHTGFGRRLAWRALAAAGVLLVSCDGREDPRAAALRAVSGGPARAVWCRDESAAGTDLFAEGRELRLVGYDTEDGRGERAILAQPGNYARPMITPRGDRVVFSDRTAGTFHAVGFDGRGLRTLGTGFAFDTWVDPETGAEWVYYGADPRPVERQDEETYRAVCRRPLDADGPVETVWTRTPVTMLSENNFQLSADGRRASLVGPDLVGVAGLPDLAWQPYGKGCWPSLAPDNSYHFWHFDGGHRTLSIYAPGAEEARKVIINTAPGMDGLEAFHPRWSNHPRTFACSGPLRTRGGGHGVEVYAGRFGETLENVEAWCRLTENDRADFYPDLWVAAGRAVWPPATAEAAAGSVAAAAVAENAWPFNRAGTVFLWDRRGAVNEVSAADGRPVICTLEARGRARYDRHLGLRLDGGWFTARSGADVLADGCRGRGRLAFEAAVTPPAEPPAEAVVIALGGAEGAAPDFTLEQRGASWIFRLRNTAAGNTPQTWNFGPLPAGGPVHLAVSAQPGRVAVYVNGNAVLDAAIPAATFANWTGGALRFGDPEGRWAGRLAMLAFYNRWMTGPEAAENAERVKRRLERRAPPRVLAVEARLLEASTRPALEDIRPDYRRALVGDLYEVVRVLEGACNAKEIMVARWAILDEQLQDVPAGETGRTARLALEAFDDRPDLKGERLFTDVNELGQPVYLVSDE